MRKFLRRGAVPLSAFSLLCVVAVGVPAGAATTGPTVVSPTPDAGGPTGGWADVITSTGTPYTAYGAWHTGCGEVVNAAFTQTLTCGVSTTSGNSFSGSLVVSLAALSADLGYSAQSTFTVSSSDSVTVLKGQTRIGEWRLVYTDTVVQEAQIGTGSNFGQTSWTGSVTESKYVNVGYQFVA